MKPHDPARDTEEERFQSVVQLLRLKRYEQPGPGFEARNAAAIRTRIAALPERPASWWEGWLTRPAPALRYVTAALVVLLVGVGLLRLQRPADQPDWATAIREAPALAEAAPPAPTNDMADTYSKPVFVFEAPSNRAPRGGADYGTGPALPVRYDY